MKNNSGHLLTLLLALILLSGCDYEAKLYGWNTDLNIDVTEIHGSYAYISITPDNDDVLFYFAVMRRDEFEKRSQGCTELEFQKKELEESLFAYKLWKESWTGDTEYYLADFHEHSLYHSPVYGYVMELEADCEYYVYGFVVDPYDDEPVGRIQKKLFRSAISDAATPDVSFDFMINDTGGKFHYFVRPTQKGHICMEPFIANIFTKDEVMSSPYGGDIDAFFTDWTSNLKNRDNYIDVDIAKFDSGIEMIEGNNYIILANTLSNLGKISPFSLSFTYHQGMKTSYSHDEQ